MAHPAIDILKSINTDYGPLRCLSVDGAVSLLKNINVYGSVLTNCIALITKSIGTDYGPLRCLSQEDAEGLIRALNQRPRR